MSVKFGLYTDSQGSMCEINELAKGRLHILKSHREANTEACKLYFF